MDQEDTTKMGRRSSAFKVHHSSRPSLKRDKPLGGESDLIMASRGDGAGVTEWKKGSLS